VTVNVLNLLGPIEARVDGALVDVPGGASRVVLAVLGAAGAAVTSTELAEAIREHTGRHPAKATVHTAIWRLRQTLGETWVRSPGPRIYGLGPDVAVDVVEFEATLAEGLCARKVADFERAVAQLRRAMAIWRGALDGVMHGTSVVRPTVDRLLELRSVVAEELAEALLDLSRPGGAVPLLEDLVAREPLREHAWAILADAYLRQGNVQNAVTTLDRARMRLAEYGLDPGIRLRQLGSSALALADRTSGDAAPAPSTAPIGRERELAAVTARLRDGQQGYGRVSVVTGGSGMGKTCLATAVADQALASGLVVRFHSGLHDDADAARETEQWMLDRPRQVDDAETAARALLVVDDLHAGHALTWELVAAHVRRKAAVGVVVTCNRDLIPDEHRQRFACLCRAPGAPRDGARALG